jgi:hypothetical protein
MQHHNNAIASSFRILRSCQSLKVVSDDALLDLISKSIQTFATPVYDFDINLPQYLHANCGGKPQWVPMTCATIHISNVISDFGMSEKEVLCFIRHVHLLYRFDDFLETIPSVYSINDVSSIVSTIFIAFERFDSGDTASDSNPDLSSTETPLPARNHCQDGKSNELVAREVLEHDMLDLIKLLHASPVTDASQYNQAWYTAELRRLLIAMAQQLLEQRSKNPSAATSKDTWTTLRTWLHSTGATSVGTCYQFAFLACLISARDQNSYWHGTQQQYLAQTFAHHVSAGWRIWNDIGGRVRDEQEGAFTSCSFVPESDLKSLMLIADYEADCTLVAQRKLCELLSHSQAEKIEGYSDWKGLEFFRKAVHLSGEIYTAGDPTRT